MGGAGRIRVEDRCRQRATVGGGYVAGERAVGRAGFAGCIGYLSRPVIG